MTTTTSSTTTNTTTTTTAPYLCASPTQLTVVTSDGTNFYDSCPNADRLGNDIFTFVPVSMQACIDSCTSNIECLGVEYRRTNTPPQNQQFCWLKGMLAKVISASYIEGLRTNTNRTTPATCAGQTIVQAASGVYFIACSGYDRPGTPQGGNLIVNGVMSPQACTDRCGSDIRCGSWTWRGAVSQCVLQYLPGLTTLAGHDMALLRTP